jgi:hypothetical protein
MHIVPCEAYCNIEELLFYTLSTAKQFYYSIRVLHLIILTLSLLMLYIYGAGCKARNFNVYIRTYVWQL